jgi:outer membrane protein assembly factor BamE (lipoprotein component of BamABCDE complex)
MGELERIKSEIKSKTTLATENIALGMTRNEVEKILGNPRSRENGNYNYGNV